MAGAIPEDCKYSKDHEWVRERGSEVVVGITDHAQRQLGDIVYVELPALGARFEAAEPFGSVESVKAVSEVYAPVNGAVAEINEGLNDSPELINDDPYGEGWLIVIRMENTDQLAGLLTAAEYEHYIKEEEEE